MVETCPSCGTSNPDSNRFCTNCGLSLSTNQQEATPSSPEPPPADARKVCTGCRTVNEASAAYCYRCGLKLPDRLYSRAEVGGSPAGFWIRLAASLIDSMFLFIAQSLITASFVGFDPEQIISELSGESTNWAATSVSLGVSIAYYTFPVGLWGRTAGKAILGLKVTRVDGSRLTYWRSFGRFWAYLISAVPFGLGFVAIALSSQKRGWHDFICDTRVVNLRS